jgi:AGCS family alanine or glycine:cation symporter
MWIMALLGAASAFCESTLAQVYKTKAGDDFLGGPAYYIQRGLGKKGLGVLYAILLIGCTGFGWNTTTAYNMSASLEYYIDNYRESNAPIIFGIILAILVGIIICGGVKRIGVLSSVLVPIMAVIYIVFGIICIVTNIGQLPSAIVTIFKDAFNFSALTGGFAGSCIVQGVKRGLFSNEAGMGTGPNAAAAASCEHPVVPGLAQMISVFLDTLVICSATALILLVSGVEGTAENAGSPFVQQAVYAMLGSVGIHIVTLALMLFAFTTLLGNYFYAEQNLKFITENRIVLYVFRAAALAVIFIGTRVSFDTAWNITDILMALVAIVNILAVFALRKVCVATLKNYEESREATEEPVFRAKDIGLTNTDCWK